MLPEKEKPTKENRPAIPKGNKFLKKSQGNKARIPQRKKFKKVVVDMVANGDWVHLTVDLEDQKGNVVKRVKTTVSNIVVSSRPADKARQKLDAELERIEEQFHREEMCKQKCLIGHDHTG